MRHLLPFAVALTVLPASAQEPLTAEVLPWQRMIVSAQVGGRVQQVPATEGAVVAAGDTLVELDGTAQRIAVARVRALVAAAEAGIATAELELQIARRELSVAERERKIAAERLPQAEQAVAAAEARLAEATTLFEAGRAPHGDVQQARLDLARAQETWSTNGEKVKAAQDRAEIGKLVVQQREVAIQAARAERALHGADLELAELELAATRVTAPFAGVVHRVFATPGEFVLPHETTLVEVLDLSRVRLRFEVDLETGRRLRPGLACTVLGGDATLAAKLAAVDATVDPTTGTRGAEVVLPNADGAWLVGTTATVTLRLP